MICQNNYPMNNEFELEEKIENPKVDLQAEYKIIDNYVPEVDTVSKEKWENSMKEKMKQIEKYSLLKEMATPKINPFPLTNFSSVFVPYIDKIIVFGGSGRFGKYNTLYTLDFNGLEPNWTLKETSKTAPIARINHTLVNNDKFCYLFGGETSGYMTSFSNEFYELNCDNWSWKKLPNGPQERAGHSSVIVDDYLYIYGGYNSETTFSDLWKYNFKTEEWKKLDLISQPKGRAFQLMYYSEITQQIYVLGGISLSKTPLKEIWSFNVKSETWNELYFKILPDQPISTSSYIPGKNSSGCIIGTKIIMFGGETLITYDSETSNEINDFIIFDIEKYDLYRCGDLQQMSIIGHQLIWRKDKFYIIGGVMKQGFFMNNFHYLSCLPIDFTLLGQNLLKGRLFNKSIINSMSLMENKGLKLPYIIKESVKYLMKEGIIEGIFRKSGRHTDIIYLTLLFENGCKFKDKEFDDPHVVSCVLKRYLLSLPEPLLTFELYQDLIKSKDSDQLKEIIKKLHPLNHEVNRLLFYLFKEVEHNKDVTLMKSENLQIILGYTLLREKNLETPSLIKETSSTIDLLISDYNNIF